MSKGYGFNEIVNERIIEGVPPTKVEHPDYADYSVYIGRTHVIDHETKHEARGPMKIGRAKYTNNIQRARNQGGGDFRIYARVLVNDNKYTREIEKHINKKYNHRITKGSQNQTELYDFIDNEIDVILDEIKLKFPHAIKDIRIYI